MIAGPPSGRMTRSGGCGGPTRAAYAGDVRVVLAPDSFGGTIDAVGAAAALAEGWRSVRPHDEVVALPMADGGEGTHSAVAAAQPAAVERGVEVADARGLATSAAWLELPDGTALVEVARACGLARVPPEQRDPLLTTSYGAGQLVAAAVATRPRRVVVGLGGTATVDGGAGAATALGARLRRADGNGVKVGARWLAELDRLTVVPAPPGVEIVLAADVTSPLLGALGAAARFAVQKGATPDDLPLLEAALEHWADVVEREVPGGPWRDLAGAGAAGGLGFGLAALLGGRLVAGAGLVADLVGLDEALRGADLVVTGEGSLDETTAAGKVVAHVAGRARAASVPVVAIAGSVDADVAGRLGLAGTSSVGEAGLRDPAGALRAAGAALAASA